jgi:hypothetical protein
MRTGIIAYYPAALPYNISRGHPLPEYHSGSGSRVFMTKNWGKIYSKKNKVFWIKNYNLPIPRPPKRKSKLQQKPSALKREHPAH